MKANPLLVRWHEDNAPIYSAAFEHGPKGRLATAGGDNNVRVGAPTTTPLPAFLTFYSHSYGKSNKTVKIARSNI